MHLKKAKQILTLAANDPDHGDMPAYGNQDVAAKVILAESARLEQKNLRLRANTDIK